MGKCGKRAFENGGNISKADQLIAEMNAKYGVSGNAQPAAPAPAPAPQPQPQPAPQQPQQRGLVGNAMQLFGNRGKQIDKAAGYRNGGIVRGFELGGIPDFKDDSQAGLEKRLAAMQAANGGASGSVTAQWNSQEQNDLMNKASGVNPTEDFAKKLGSSLMSAFSQQGAQPTTSTSGNLFPQPSNPLNKDPLQSFSNGGKIKGPGTPTSDSIPARVNETGEEIRVSNGERIVSAEQGALLEALARKSGFDSLDAMLEAGTGKPVGPTMKGGKPAAAGGWNLDNSPDEYAKAMQGARNIMSIPPLVTNNKSAQGGIYKDVGIPALATNNSAAQGGIYKDVGLPSISIGAGQAPTIYDNGGLRTNTDRVSGSLPVANVSRINSPSENVTGNNRIGIFDKDPLAALSEAIGKNNAAVDAANAGVQKLYPEGTFDKTAKTQAGIAVGAQPTPSVNPLVAGIVDSSFAPAKDRFPLDAKSEFITGKNGAMPDSSGGGFVDGNTAYTVKPTSQDGISRVTAPGKNPLYTNISPEAAVAGLNKQTIGQPSDQEAQGLARIARAVAINKERIDAQPMGGIAVLPDQADEANAKLDAMRQSSLVSGLSPSQQAAFQQAQAQLAMQGRGQQLTADNARYAADVQAQRAAGHDQVIARGQDLNAQNEERRIAGNPLDNQTKQLSLTQAKRISDLQDKALAGDQSAIKSLQTLTGSDQKGHFTSHVVGGGEDEMGRKLPQRLAIFDSRTGQEVQQGAAQQSGGFGKSDVDAALKAGASKEAIASRIKAMGKNPADFGL